MKVSLNLLRQLVRLPVVATDDAIAARLTMAGLEVEARTRVGAGLSGAIIAEVRGKRRHPKADKLTLVDVFDGKETTQVVCGAPNVPEPAAEGTPGPRVVWARPGATLPNGMTLSAREVRGVVSPGMLCAEDELGLSEDHGGILILSAADGLAIGADFATGAGLPDTVLELNVTPNRADCLGHLGVARELAALFAEEGAVLAPETGAFGGVDLAPWLPVAPKMVDAGAVGGEAPPLAADPLRIEAPGCRRYVLRVLSGVTVRPSPLALRLLLQRLGVRALSNIVDATNLMMLLFGQPLHAFDLAQLRGPGGAQIVVRAARAGETLKTLDGVDRPLVEGDLLIADGERPLALAGVMGGEDCEVSAGTTAVLLEAAAFAPAVVRRAARRLKMHTEASHRFERGVDPNEGLTRASAGAAALMLVIGGGRAGAVAERYPTPEGPLALTLRPRRTEALLGISLSAERQAGLLRALGLTVAVDSAQRSGAPSFDGDLLRVQVPTARPDLLREIDLIEEIARLHGYEHIAPTLPALRIHGGSPSAGPAAVADRARDLCAALGFSEIQTFSFVAPERIAQLGFVSEDRRCAPLRLANPLREELSALRTQLVIGLLEALRHNLSHGQRDLRLFEVGEVYLPAARSAEEIGRVAGVLAGARDHWLKAGPGDDLDFFDVRGVVDELRRALGWSCELRAAAPGEAPWLHPGLSAVLVADGRVIGELGEIHPDLRERLGIEVRALAFELELPKTLPASPRFVPLPRFPEVTRDLSFFVDAQVPASAIVLALRGAAPGLLSDVHVLEDYREAGRVPAGKKGLLLSLTYRSPERTLTDEEVQAAHDERLAALRAAFPIELR